jgi:hypothetical protein
MPFYRIPKRQYKIGGISIKYQASSALAEKSPLSLFPQAQWVIPGAPTCAVCQEETQVHPDSEKKTREDVLFIPVHSFDFALQH